MTDFWFALFAAAAVKPARSLTGISASVPSPEEEVTWAWAGWDCLMTLSQNRNSRPFQTTGVTGMSSQSMLTWLHGVQEPEASSRK